MTDSSPCLLAVIRGLGNPETPYRARVHCYAPGTWSRAEDAFEVYESASPMFTDALLKSQSLWLDSVAMRTKGEVMDLIWTVWPKMPIFWPSEYDDVRGRHVWRGILGKGQPERVVRS